MPGEPSNERAEKVWWVSCSRLTWWRTYETAQTTLDASFGAAVVSKTENFYKKKTHLGHKRRFLRRLGPFFSSLAPVGLCGLSWASSKPKRGVVSVVQPADVVTNLRNSPNDVSRVVWGCCCHGPALAFVGHCWVLWACVGLRWPSVGCCGPALAFAGLRSPSLCAVGLRWPALVLSGLRWPCFGLLCPSSPVVGCCGPALAFVGRRWVLWAFVDLRWPSSGAVGLRGPALTCIGRRWAMWACIGLPCAAVDLCWPSLAVVGCCGPS